MATETERKFLVTGEFRHLAIREIHIIQSYLSRDPAKTIRIRIADDKAYLTVKSPVSYETLARGEWEYQIPVSDAVEMMKLCLPGIIEKQDSWSLRAVTRSRWMYFMTKMKGL